jgi:hypothetical protein
VRASCNQIYVSVGGGFGGPIRSRLVGDGSLPEELPPARSVDLLGPPRGSSEGMDIRRSSSWRPPPESSGLTPPGDRWAGPTTPVSTAAVQRQEDVDGEGFLLQEQQQQQIKAMAGADGLEAASNLTAAVGAAPCLPAGGFSRCSWACSCALVCPGLTFCVHALCA